MKTNRTWHQCRTLLQLTLVALLCIGFTGCSDDDDEQNIVVYSAGFDSFSSSSTSSDGSTSLDEMARIEAAYFEELGITSTPFQLTGNTSECDTKVKAACGRAEMRVKAMSLKSHFVYIVVNGNTGETVYRYEYPEPNFI